MSGEYIISIQYSAPILGPLVCVSKMLIFYNNLGGHRKNIIHWKYPANALLVGPAGLVSLKC